MATDCVSFYPSEFLKATQQVSAELKNIEVRIEILQKVFQGSIYNINFKHKQFLPKKFDFQAFYKWCLYIEKESYYNKKVIFHPINNI